MTTRHPTRLQAVREALVLAVAVAALVASVILVQQRPAGPDELKIPLETLRSQYAELVLMNEQSGDALPPRFLKAHASQLASAVGEVRDQLQDMEPRADLRSLQREGLAHARRLLAAVESVRRSGAALPPASAAELQAEARQLKAHEEGLRR
jgi:hypothetical protein